MSETITEAVKAKYGSAAMSRPGEGSPSPMACVENLGTPPGSGRGVRYREYGWPDVPPVVPSPAPDD